jgi:hypothetical protein
VSRRPAGRGVSTAQPGRLTCIHPSPSLPIKMAPSAVDLLAKAQKKVASSTGWFSSSSTKYEEAADMVRPP